MTITKSDWNGYTQLNFQVNGRDSFVVCPKTTAPGAPWVWRTEFFGAFDSVDRELLERGWHIAYHTMCELYGSPTAMRYMEEFHEAVTAELGLSPYPVPFGFSRGGTFAVNFAYLHPDKVGALYLDAPYLDFTSNDALFKEEFMQNLLDAYGFTSCAELLDFHEMPIDHAEALGRQNTPVLCCVGLADRVVLYEKNVKVFEERYRAAGGTRIAVYKKPGCDHHPHSYSDPAHVKELADFLEQNWNIR